MSWNLLNSLRFENSKNDRYFEVLEFLVVVEVKIMRLLRNLLMYAFVSCETKALSIPLTEKR